MKNLFKITFAILLMNLILSNNFEFGRNLIFNGDINDWPFEMDSYSFQIYEYKPNNIYQSIRLEYLKELPLCYLGCSSIDKGLGLSSFYGTYKKGDYLLTSGSIGVGLNYIGNETILTLPINTEISIIIKKIGLTLRGMVYVIPKNYFFSLGLSLKIEDIF